MIEETPQPEEQTAALDEYVIVLEAWHETSQQIKKLKAQEETYKALLAKVMGDATVGTVDNQPVVYFRPIESFNSGDFKKKYPDTYRFFVHEVTKKEFDKDLLRRTRPELWEEFQTRPMKSSYVPPDKAQ